MLLRARPSPNRRSDFTAVSIHRPFIFSNLLENSQFGLWFFVERRRPIQEISTMYNSDSELGPCSSFVPFNPQPRWRLSEILLPSDCNSWVSYRMFCTDRHASKRTN